MSVNVNPALLGLLNYAEEKGLIEACDRTYCHNRLLQIMKMDAPDEGEEALDAPLPVLLQVLIDSAVERGLVQGPCTIVMDGGSLTIDCDKASRKVVMTGPAVTVFEGSVEV